MPVAAFREEEPDQEPIKALDIQQIIKELGQRCYAEEVSTKNVFQDISVYEDEEGEQGKVILLCKGKVKESITSPKQVRTPQKPPARLEVPEQDKLDLTGSPLRCSFNLEEDDEDDVFAGAPIRAVARSKYLPLSAIEARSLLSRYNCLTHKSPADLPPCWVMVKPESNSGLKGSEAPLIWLSSHRGHSYLTSTSVVCSGPYSTSGANGRNGPITMQKLLKPHASANSVSNGEACAVYNLSLDEGDDDETMINEDVQHPSRLQLRLQWPGPRHILEQPSPDSRAVIDAWINPGGDERTAGLWEELIMLRNFYQALDGKGMQWAAASEGDDDEGGSKLGEELNELMETVVRMGPRGNSARARRGDGTGIGDDVTEGRDVCKLLNETRGDVDFADLLWGVLRKCYSYSQLCQALTAVLRVGQKEEIRPFLQPSSQNTTLGRLVRDVMRKPDAAIPEMSGKTPIQIMVEIGTEKLRRDYVHALISSYLSTKEDLTPLLVSELPLPDLIRLHLSVELVVLLQTHLAPEQECLAEVVSKAIKQDLRDHDDDDDKRSRHFKFEVRSSHVREELAKRQPSVWQCEFKSHTDDDKKSWVETAAVLSVDPPGHFGANEFAAGEDVESRSSGGASYFHVLKTSMCRQTTS